MATIEKQLEMLEQQLARIKPERIIHNTPEAVARLNQVRRDVAWRGREIALKQEEIEL